MHRRPGLLFLANVALCLGLPAATAQMSTGLQICGAGGRDGIDFPGVYPGEAAVSICGEAFILENEALTARWCTEAGRLTMGPFTTRHSGEGGGARNGEAFVLSLANGRTIKCSELEMRGAAAVVKIPGRDGARRLAARFGGVRVKVRLASPNGAFAVDWEAELRDGSNYVVQRTTLVPTEHELPIGKVRLIDLVAPGAKASSLTQGAPIVAGSFFFALEHPMSESTVDGSRVHCELRRCQELHPGNKLTLSSVMGVTPPGQLRRGFLYYVERERAHPYRPFLHYNSWYDIAWIDRKFNESQALEAIETVGRELTAQRGVSIDCFVFDDGWDDNKTLWEFHDGFPNGFTRLREAARRYGATVGTWLSPFGGYGKAREQRLRYGVEQGYEVNRNGFSLAGKRYYAGFRGICTKMMRDYGVKFFKFDGMGPGNNKTGGEEFLEDIEALMRLVGELRELDPDLYISATTGTWCTPYFLWYADNIWRSGNDMDFTGKGSKRQQWINYRDRETYRNVVRQGPLYPLNSIMTHGIVHARHGHTAELDEAPKDFADEVWSFFGNGTSLQELYITPQLLTPEMWDILAAAARWSRANVDVLVDTHWVGGDPGRGQVYGWASWAPRKGILVLRNPDDMPAAITLDIKGAFELPDGAPSRYRLVSPGPATAATVPVEVSAGNPHVFSLNAFQTIVYDAAPINENAQEQADAEHKS